MTVSFYICLTWRCEFRWFFFINSLDTVAIPSLFASHVICVKENLHARWRQIFEMGGTYYSLVYADHSRCCFIQGTLLSCSCKNVSEIGTASHHGLMAKSHWIRLPIVMIRIRMPCRWDRSCQKIVPVTEPALYAWRGLETPSEPSWTNVCTVDLFFWPSELNLKVSNPKIWRSADQKYWNVREFVFAASLALKHCFWIACLLTEACTPFWLALFCFS